MVDARAALGRARRQRGLVPLDQPPGELALGRADRAPRPVVELDEHVGGAPGRDVGGDVDLAAPDDAEVDDALARRAVEARVGRHQPGVLEGVHQVGERFGLVDPTEELPDRAEVLDVVDQRRAGESHQQRTSRARADPAGQVEHVLRALRGLVLDEVRLVHHHAAEAELPEPADVPVEHLVVDDHDVGETVDGFAVAVNDGRLAVRRPDVRLARPVDLDDAGHDDEQRVRVRRLGREQRLRGLSQAGLVREQEGAVAGRRGGDQPLLVRHELAAGGHPHAQGFRRRQFHARRAADALEGAEQRVEQFPTRQPARGGRPARGREVRRKEGIGHLARDDRLRDDPALGAGCRQLGLCGRGFLLGRFYACRAQHLAAQRLRRVRHDRVVRQQGEQRRVEHGGRREDLGDPVEALGLLGAVVRRAGLVLADPVVFLADEQRDGLELRPHGRRHAPALGRRLDVADGAREHRDDVVRTGATLVARCGTAGARLALTRSSQELLLQSPGRGRTRCACRRSTACRIEHRAGGL